MEKSWMSSVGGAALPIRDEIGMEIDESLIVEFYSREALRQSF